MHRDRLRWLINEDELDTLGGATEMVRGAKGLLCQLDAAAAVVADLQAGRVPASELVGALVKALEEH